MPIKQTRHLGFWLLLDAIYILLLFNFPGLETGLTLPRFFWVHGLAIGVGSMVMFSGLGAGVLWIPVLTFLDLRPSEAVSISIFTQIAGKGTGSLTYLVNGMVDTRIVAAFTPMALIGVTLGFLAHFFMPQAYERILIYLFLVIAGYLLIKTILSLKTPETAHNPDGQQERAPLYKSVPVVTLSSFFTGLLSIGNTDWLIPHMTLRLNMSTARAVATGLFIMSVTTLFYLFLSCLTVWTGQADWPQGTELLFATCAGVILGGQIGTRLVRVPWFKAHQKHAFIVLLGLSLIHLFIESQC